MGYSVTDAQNFLNLFQSNPRAVGVTTYGEMEGEKLKGNSKLIHEPVSIMRVEKHFEGIEGLGLSPLLDNGTCRWAAIDIDDYDGDMWKIVEAINEYNLPLVPCLSKSRKLHIYVFFSEPAPAKAVRDYLSHYISLFRLPEKVEIFPKQVEVSATQRFPSWINLPYFDVVNEGWRRNVKNKRETRDVGEFIDWANRCKVSLDEHVSRQQSLPYASAPPCIASGVIFHDIAPGSRNTWFYNVACYLRMQDEDVDVEEEVLKINATLSHPLPSRELQDTVLKMKSSSSFYRCQEMMGCRKALCKKIEKGIGNKKDTIGFSLGQLVRVNSQPVYWKWEVNGVLLTFYRTEDLMRQDSFRKQCMEKLMILPYQVDSGKWTSIIRRHLQTAKTEEVEVSADFGTGAQLLREIAKFFDKRRDRTEDKDAVAMGRVYEEAGWLFFKASALESFIVDLNKITGVTSPMIREKIQELGGVMTEEGYWRVEEERLPKLTQKEIEVNYKDVEGYDNAEYGF